MSTADRPLTPRGAEDAYNAAEPAPVSAGRIREIVRYATRGVTMSIISPFAHLLAEARKLPTVEQDDLEPIDHFGPVPTIGEVRRLLASHADLVDAVEALFPADDWARFEGLPLKEQMTVELLCTRDELLALRAALARAKE